MINTIKYVDVLATNKTETCSTALRTTSCKSAKQNSMAKDSYEVSAPESEYPDYSIIGENYCKEAQDSYAQRRAMIIDYVEFQANNPNVSEREVWNYIDEKYNLNRSSGMKTLEEAQEMFKLGSLFNSSLTDGFKTAPNALIGNNSLKFNYGSKITLNNGYSIMFDESYTYLLRNGKALTLQDYSYNPNYAERQEFEYTKHVAAFLNTLRNFDSRNPGVNQLDLSAHGYNSEQLLREIGIDPSKEFAVNGVRFVLDSSSGIISRV